MKTPVTDSVLGLTKAYVGAFFQSAQLSTLSRTMQLALGIGSGTTTGTVHDLAQSVAFPWFTLPPELRCMIRTLLDAPSQLALAASCGVERDYYTAEQISLLLVQKKALTVMSAAPLTNLPAEKRLPLHFKKIRILAHLYTIILSRLLDPAISEQACKELAAVTEKFFAHLSSDEIKKQLNYVLSIKPADYPWQLVFEKLARVNLHLCVTVISKASPGFNVANEDVMRAQVREATYIHYPFTELYPMLVQKLQFAPTGETWAKGYCPTPDNIQLDNPRATQFFRGIRHGFWRDTALHFALITGYLDIVPALVQDHSCIDLIIDNIGGATALILVAKEMRRIRVKSGIRLRDKEIFTQGIYLLLQLHADPSIQDYYGNTALTRLTAGECVDPALVTALLQAGAPVNAKDEKGKTALMYSAEISHATVVQILLRAGADPNVQEKGHGYTALMYAVQNNDVDIVRLLINWGVDRSLQDYTGNTALMQALAKRHLQVAALLQEKEPTQ
jgi:hypothetical protein